MSSIDSVSDSSSQSELEEIADAYAEGVDSQDEIEDLREEAEEEIGDSIEDKEATLEELQASLAGELSDEAREYALELEKELLALIENYKTLDDLIDEKFDEVESNLYDGSNGSDQNISDIELSDQETDPIIVTTGDASSVFTIDAPEENTDEEDTNGDGFVNAADLLTSDYDARLLNQVFTIPLDEGWLVDVMSFNESSGNLVLKVYDESGNYKMIEINNFNPEKHILILEGTEFITEKNEDLWKNAVPDCLLKAIWPFGSTDENDYNLYDFLSGNLELSLDERLAYTGYAEVTNEDNVAQVYNKYASSMTSGLTLDKMKEVMNDAAYALYQMIDDTTLLSDPDLTEEAMAAFTTDNSLSTDQIAEAISIAVLTMLEFDPDNTSTLLAGNLILDPILSALAASKDESGENPNALATATTILVNDKLYLGTTLDYDTLALGYTVDTDEVDEEGNPVTTTNYDSMVTALNLTQNMYSNLGYGTNTAVEEALETVEADIIAAEEAKELADSQVAFGEGELEALQNNAWMYGQQYGNWANGIEKDTLSEIMNSFVENLNMWITTAGITAAELATQIYMYISAQNTDHKDDVAGTIVCLLGDFAPSILTALMQVEGFSVQMQDYYRNGGLSTPNSAAGADRHLSLTYDLPTLVTEIFNFLKE